MKVFGEYTIMYSPLVLLGRDSPYLADLEFQVLLFPFFLFFYSTLKKKKERKEEEEEAIIKARSGFDMASHSGRFMSF